MHRVRSRRTSSESVARRHRVCVEAVEPRTMLSVNLVFDYSKDVSGFFTDPARRASLQAAADAVTGAMTDFLDPIVPSGTDQWTISFNDPGTGMQTTVDNPIIPEDTIIVYAGSYDLPGAAIGLGGFAGYSTTGSAAFNRTVRARGNNGALSTNNPSDFAPFAGSIAFDSTVPFYFGSDPAGLQSTDNDFLSVAEHELVHLLGFPRARSFDRYVQTDHTFTGPKSMAVYGGPVPLETDDAHWLDGTTVTNAGGAEALEDPTLTVGTRKTITPLDLAALDDLGWDFDPVPLPVVSLTSFDTSMAEPNNPGNFRLSRSGRTSAALDVTLTFAGTAFRNSDYTITINGTDNNPDNDQTFTGTTITIPIGASSISFTVHAVDDDVIEPEETAVIGVGTDPDYTVGTDVTFTIEDEDLVKRQDIREAASIADIGTNGNPSDLGAFFISLSADGRYATFVSNSTNLVGSPLTTFYQVYRRDLVGGTTTLVSLALGEQSEANDDAALSKISASGRYIAYETYANNIVKDGADTNSVLDVYLKDMVTNATSLVTKGVGGELLAISNDGEEVLFQSTSSAAFFVKGITDQNGGNDLFVWNRRTGKYTCISTDSTGTATGDRSTVGGSTVGLASFSGDGRFVVFPSRASNLVADVVDGNTFQYDLFIRDIAAGKTEYVSVSAEPTVGGDNLSGDGEATLDGRYVVFRSSADDLVAGVTDTNKTQDIFLRDRLLGTTTLLSRRKNGVQTGNGGNGVPDITSDGRYVVFTSTSTNISKGDTNQNSDAFLIDTRSLKIELLTQNNRGDNGGGAPTTDAKISDDGSRVGLLTFADDLPGDFDKKDVNFAAIYTRDTIIDENSVVTFERSGNPAGADASDMSFSADGTRIAFSSDSSSITKVDLNHQPDVFTAPVWGHEPARIDANGILTVLGSIAADSINVQRVNSTITVRRNEEAFDFKASGVLGINVLTGDGDDSVVLGTNLIGTYVSAGNGNDTVRGGGGGDRIQGGPGRDLLYGGAGDDRIDGGKGVDSLFGESGSDRLYGGDSDDQMDGGSGVDRFFGGLGNDTSVNHEDSDIYDSIEILA